MLNKKPPLHHALALHNKQLSRHALLSLTLMFALNISEAQVAPALTQPFAQQLNPSNYPQLAVHGPDALSGIGDWVLSNGVICAAISNIDHETYLSYRGGTLIDLAHCGQANDQWNTLHGLFNLSKKAVVHGERIRAYQDGQSAGVTVTATLPGADATTTYHVTRAQPHSLSITYRLTRNDQNAPLSMFGVLTLHPHRSLTPFSLNLAQPELSKGFEHPAVDAEKKRQMIRAMRANDLHVLTGSPLLQPEISYGFQHLSSHREKTNGEQEPLRYFALNDHDFTLFGYFSNPLWFDTDHNPGLMQFMQTLFMDLQVGESLVVKQRIIVGARANVAAITDQIYSGPTVSGTLTPPNTALLLRDNTGQPLTFVTANTLGEFSLRLPKTDTHYTLELRHHNQVKHIPLNVGKHDIRLAPLRLGTPGQLVLPQGQPMRLTFKGINNTPDPYFHHDARHFMVGNDEYHNSATSHSVFLAGVASDQQVIELPSGDYTVFASRGIEYSVTQTPLFLKPGESQTLNIAPPVRDVETPGWVNADFHVHAAPSFDSDLPIQQRLVHFVALGGEVLAATDHDNIVDYAPYIHALGLNQRLHYIAGTELTGMAATKALPHTIGHVNVYPIQAQSDQFAGGSPAHEGRSFGQVLNTIKEAYPNALFQLNHPRGAAGEHGDNHFFEHLGSGQAYNPNQPINHKQHTALQANNYAALRFDAIELLNGSNQAAYQASKRDWFSLLQQGFVSTAMANSDSHGSEQLVTIPRNYLRVKNDQLKTITTSEVIKSVIQGTLFGSNGPLLFAQYHGRSFGQMSDQANGTLAINVQSASWIPVDTLRVYINGQLAHTQSLRETRQIDMSLSFEKDSFIFIEVSGEASELYKTLMPGHTPLAFGNPIFIDANANGTWEAPGLTNNAQPNGIPLSH